MLRVAAVVLATLSVGVAGCGQSGSDAQTFGNEIEDDLPLDREARLHFPDGSTLRVIVQDQERGDTCLTITEAEVFPSEHDATLRIRISDPQGCPPD